MSIMGMKIKTLRKLKGWSQQELADRAKISRSQLSEIETEAKYANTRRLNDIAAALGVTVEELFDTNAKPDYEAKIVTIMRTLQDEDRESVIRHALALSSSKVN